LILSAFKSALAYMMPQNSLFECHGVFECVCWFIAVLFPIPVSWKICPVQQSDVVCNNDVKQSCTDSHCDLSSVRDSRAARAGNTLALIRSFHFFQPWRD